jgi:hypothetical protein
MVGYASSGTQSFNAEIEFTAPATNTYFVEVRHSSHTGTGDYGLWGGLTPAPPFTLQPYVQDHGVDASTATPLLLNAAPTPGLITLGPSLVDWFSIPLTAGQPYRFRVETDLLANGVDTALTLVDTDGTTVLTANDDFPGLGLGSGIDFTPTTSGTYFVHVRGRTRSATGNYEIRVE